jgi:outer membrane protein TolC
MGDRNVYRTKALTTIAIATLSVMLVAPVPAQSEMEEYDLTLREALMRALDNNLDLVSARYGPELRKQDIDSQEAGFDVGLEGNYRRTESEQPALQLSTVTGSKTDNFSVGVAQNLKFGADYRVGMGTFHRVQTGPNVVAPTSYISGLEFDFNLPILKGFGTDVTTEQLIISRNDYEISLTDLEGQAEQTIETVEGAYWDVLAAREALRIARLALTRAEDLLELNRKKVEVGTLAPIEITQAEAGVASQEEGVIVAEINLRDAEDELRRLLAIPESDPMWNMAINCVDRPGFEVREVDLESAINTAMQSRPEMLSSEQTVRNRELSERVARRQIRHQLDFNANYQPQGASLDFPAYVWNPFDDSIVPPENADLGPSATRIFNGDVYSWAAGLTYRVPIGNRAAKADFARAKLSREQAEVDLRNQEQTIRVEVRRAARAVDSGIKRVEAAELNVELQRKKLEAEQKKFDNGMSTSFEVLTFQNDLADAELSEIRAKLDYIKALAALERSKGTLLEDRGLKLGIQTD